MATLHLEANALQKKKKDHHDDDNQDDDAELLSSWLSYQRVTTMTIDDLRATAASELVDGLSS